MLRVEDANETLRTLSISPESISNVRDYGAVGDGGTIDSGAINHAIEAASRAGGGTVHFPAGQYASYSIRLRSRVRLYLDHGAIIVAADASETAGYDLPEDSVAAQFPYQDFGHSHWSNSLIWGIDLHDIAIEGPGLICGQRIGQRRFRARSPARHAAWRRQQGDRATWMPQRHSPRFLDPRSRPFRRSCDRHQQPQD